MAHANAKQYTNRNHKNFGLSSTQDAGTTGTSNAGTSSGNNTFVSTNSNRKTSSSGNNPGDVTLMSAHSSASNTMQSKTSFQDQSLYSNQIPSTNNTGNPTQNSISEKDNHDASLKQHSS